jgi:MFS family permease
MVVSAVMVHLLPFFIGFGIAPTLAATMLGSVAMISIVGRLGFGHLADIIDKRYVMSVCLALVALGFGILATAQVMWHLIVFLAIYPLGYGGGAILMNAIRGEYFGRRYFGTIMGYMDLFQVFGNVLGPVFAGLVYDATESYRIAFITFAVVAGVATILILIVRRPVLVSSTNPGG